MLDNIVLNRGVEMKDRDKVILLTESLASGGAERQLVSLAVLLKRNRENVVVWTYYPDDFYLPLLDQANVAHQCVANGLSRGRRLIAIIRELYKAKPSAVVAYLDTACVMACVAKMVLRLSGRDFRLIVSERNVTQKLSFRERIKFYSYRFADFIVPNSYTQGEFIRQNYPSLTDKVKVITNFIDLDFFHPTEYEGKSDMVRILSVARVSRQKNVLNYIRAIKNVVECGMNVQVDWYGESLDENYYKRCCEEVKLLRLEGIFEFHPSSRDVRSAYWNVDVFCLPSLYEGFPNVLCEAMACGLPIACSRVCDNERIVENGENAMLFDPNDVDDMTKKMISILHLSEKERREMGRKSREIIETKFSSDTFINQYLDLIHG